MENKFKPSWALFGYKVNDRFGDFLAERDTREELDEIKKWARSQGYVKFSCSYAGGQKPDFIKAINLK